MKTSLLMAATAVALAAGSLSTQAACVHRTKTGNTPAAQPMKLPALPHDTRSPSGSDDSIVGLWHVEHRLPDGSLYFESFEHYHADGTEFEFANINPILGDVCMGVFTQKDSRTVSLYHIGWIFDDAGNPAGTFTLEGPRKISANGKHLKGTFDAKIYDVDGNLVEEDTGNTTGDRIPAP
ncbi:MAG: hypothetical protein JO208_11360 [Alphaproteobacteria bacterium]|nr:hypothetical protein [Alphaproteobacteria bacterium]